jgi:hypothetical protein
MSPLYQTGLTLVCMGFTYFWGLHKGLRAGSNFICNMLTKKELIRVLKKIQEDKKS